MEVSEPESESEPEFESESEAVAEKRGRRGKEEEEEEGREGTRAPTCREIPPEILREILRNADPKTLARAARVSSKWLEVAQPLLRAAKIGRGLLDPIASLSEPLDSTSYEVSRRPWGDVIPVATNAEQILVLDRNLRVVRTIPLPCSKRYELTVCNDFLFAISDVGDVHPPSLVFDRNGRRVHEFSRLDFIQDVIHFPGRFVLGYRSGLLKTYDDGFRHLGTFDFFRREEVTLLSLVAWKDFVVARYSDAVIRFGTLDVIVAREVRMPHGDTIDLLTFGDLLVGAGFGGDFAVWNAKSELLRTFNVTDGEIWSAVRFGSLIACGFGDGSVATFDLFGRRASTVSTRTGRAAGFVAWGDGLVAWNHRNGKIVVYGVPPWDPKASVDFGADTE